MTAERPANAANYSSEIGFWTQRIREHVPFAFSRWGDGEWACLLGDEGENCDRHQYFPALRDDLRAALTRAHPYYKGHLAVSRNAGADRIAKFLATVPRQNWVDGDVMLTALLAGKLGPFAHALQSRRVLYVGPPHLAGLPELAGWSFGGYCTVPPVNAYRSKDVLLGLIRGVFDHKQADVVGFSAGMLTNVLIDELWPEYGARVTMIDFGSMWDGFFGVRSRSYHKRHVWSVLRGVTFGVA